MVVPGVAVAVPGPSSAMLVSRAVTNPLGYGPAAIKTCMPLCEAPNNGEQGRGSMLLYWGYVRPGIDAHCDKLPHGKGLLVFILILQCVMYGKDIKYTVLQARQT